MDRKKLIFLIVGVLIVAGAASIFYFYKMNPSALNAAGGDDSHETEDFFARIDARETGLLAAKDGSPKVIREVRTLHVTPTAGEPIVFKDCLDCGPEKDVEHYLADRFTDPAAVLVYRQFYESDDYVLVTADGSQHEIPSYPVFSPDKQSFVAVSAAEAFNWNGVEVWEKEGTKFQRKLRYEPKGSELYRFTKWDGNDKILLEYSHYQDPDSGKAVCQEAQIVRHGHTWTMESLNKFKDDFCPYTEDWIPEALRRYGKDARGDGSNN